MTGPLFPLEYEKNRSFVLQEVDASSEVIGQVTMLNTLRHYKVRNWHVNKSWTSGGGLHIDLYTLV